jgi:hypothetical protein
MQRGYPVTKLASRSTFRYLDLLDHRLLVDEVLGRVPAVGADPGRQPLPREQLVHGDPGEPCHAQREGRRDRPLAGRHLLDAVPLVAERLRQRPPGPNPQPQEPQRGRCSLSVRPFMGIPSSGRGDDPGAPRRGPRAPGSPAPMRPLPI